MLTVWDIWQFRNSLLHAEDGPLKLEEHDYYNEKIRNEFIIGDYDFTPADQAFFSKRSLQELIESDLDIKKAWYVRVQAARTAVILREGNNETTNDNNHQQDLNTIDRFLKPTVR